MRVAPLALFAFTFVASGCGSFRKAAKADHPATTNAAREPEATEPESKEKPEADGRGVTDCGTGRSHKGTLEVPKSELEGIASYYGKQHDGKQTASGDLFDMNKFSAAHRTLRLGTKVRVTNMDNGRSLEVCINDRGPYAKDRILDLSYGAAKELGVLGEGTAPVKIEIIGKK